MICTLAVMYSYVHSSNTTLWLFSVVIKDFFFTQQLWTKNTIAQKLETQFRAGALNGIQTPLWLSEPIQWEYAAVGEMVSSCLQMEVSVTGTVGTLAQRQCAAALGSSNDASTEVGTGGGGTGERSVFSSLLPFLYCLCFLFWKPLRSKFPHSERGDEKAPSFETCPSSNVNKRGDDSYL